RPAGQGERGWGPVRGVWGEAPAWNSRRGRLACGYSAQRPRGVAGGPLRSCGRIGFTIGLRAKPALGAVRRRAKRDMAHTDGRDTRTDLGSGVPRDPGGEAWILTVAYHPDGSCVGRRVALRDEDEIVLGRRCARFEAGSFDDSLVSRRHVVMSCRAHELGARDLGSRNGTFVNGARVDRSPLADGDVLTIGRVLVLVHRGPRLYRRSHHPALVGQSAGMSAPGSAPWPTSEHRARPRCSASSWCTPGGSGRVGRHPMARSPPAISSSSGLPARACRCWPAPGRSKPTGSILSR
ncbi:MAG: FHA domain-containing protein, partial [Deltaproteobacteria bacterium]|nr:FHA domain-containing protein [Deltaproteobacteria bacterium]